MARVDRLPPPPALPLRSPPVHVPGEILTRLEGADGVAPGPLLEARMHVPASPVRAVVLCHPHPLYGGSMHSPVPLAIAKTLADLVTDQAAWVRFNFRGVGQSEGGYDGGAGEVDDALAAVAALRAAVARVTSDVVPISLCGHSFGSAVALRAVARDAGIDRVLLLAPSARLFALSRAERQVTAKATVFIGDKDELCDLDDARELARDLGAELRVFAGYDHHFLKSRRAMAEAALPVLVPEAISP